MLGSARDEAAPLLGRAQMLRPVRERAVDLPPIQREALDAAFGLTSEVAPEHYRIAMASLDLVSDVAGDAPVLLVVDDAQWLDSPTADVLAFVARRIESDPVVLLAAARDGYPSPLADAGLPEHRLAGGVARRRVLERFAGDRKLVDEAGEAHGSLTLVEQQRPQRDVAFLVDHVVGVPVRGERDALDALDHAELVDRLDLDGAARGARRQ